MLVKKWQYNRLFIISLSQSKHKLPHPPVHDGGSPNGSHRLRQRRATGGWASASRNVSVPQRMCNGTRNQDNPSDRYGRLPSDILRQMSCCAPQGAIPLSTVRSAPIPWGRRAHRPCPRDKGHEPANTSSCNNWALAE